MADVKTKQSPSGKKLEARTIRFLSFPYYNEELDPLDPDESRMILQLLTADRDEVVYLRPVDIKRGEVMGAFKEAFTDSGAPDVDPDVDIVDMDDAELEAHLRETKPSVGDTVAAAGSNADLATRLLDAETRATDGDPRKGVVDGLGKVIQDAGR